MLVLVLVALAATYIPPLFAAKAAAVIPAMTLLPLLLLPVLLLPLLL